MKRLQKRTLHILTSLCVVLMAGCSSPEKKEPVAEDSSIAIEKKGENKIVIEFNGECAHSVSNGKFGIPGDARYSLQYRGKTYYFGSQAALDRFSKKVEYNIARAQERWNARTNAGSSR